jgi:hypothetical protein
LGGAWTPTFSPGGHSALTETLLPEDPAGAVIILNGLGTETAVYGSPFISPASLTHAIPDHTFHTALGNAEAIDWNDSGAATPALIVSRDVSNFGITGCGATGPTSTSYTDFNDSDLFSFNFRAEPSGQFDGITIFLSDQDDDVFYGTLLAAGQFDGLDSPVPNNKSKKGSSIPLKLDVTIPGTGVVDIIGVHGEVWVSPINDIDGPYVTQLTNHLTGGTDVVWNPVTRQITFVWKTPSNLPLGDYYLRVFLTDPEGGFIGGLAADPDNIPGSGFLTDLVLPYKLPLDLNGAAPPPPQRFEATDKVTIIK